MNQINANSWSPSDQVFLKNQMAPSFFYQRQAGKRDQHQQVQSKQQQMDKQAKINESLNFNQNQTTDLPSIRGRNRQESYQEPMSIGHRKGSSLNIREGVRDEIMGRRQPNMNGDGYGYYQEREINSSSLTNLQLQQTNITVPSRHVFHEKRASELPYMGMDAPISPIFKADENFKGRNFKQHMRDVVGSFDSSRPTTQSNPGRRGNPLQNGPQRNSTLFSQKYLQNVHRNEGPITLEKYSLRNTIQPIEKGTLKSINTSYLLQQQTSKSNQNKFQPRNFNHSVQIPDNFLRVKNRPPIKHNTNKSIDVTKSGRFKQGIKKSTNKIALSGIFFAGHAPLFPESQFINRSVVIPKVEKQKNGYVPMKIQSKRYEVESFQETFDGKLTPGKMLGLKQGNQEYQIQIQDQSQFEQNKGDEKKEDLSKILKLDINYISGTKMDSQQSSKSSDKQIIDDITNPILDPQIEEEGTPDQTPLQKSSSNSKSNNIYNITTNRDKQDKTSSHKSRNPSLPKLDLNRSSEQQLDSQQQQNLVQMPQNSVETYDASISIIEQEFNQEIDTSDRLAIKNAMMQDREMQGTGQEKREGEGLLVDQIQTEVSVLPRGAINTGRKSGSQDQRMEGSRRVQRLCMGSQGSERESILSNQMTGSGRKKSKEISSRDPSNRRAGQNSGSPRKYELSVRGSLDSSAKGTMWLAGNAHHSVTRDSRETKRRTQPSPVPEQVRETPIEVTERGVRGGMPKTKLKKSSPPQKSSKSPTRKGTPSPKKQSPAKKRAAEASLLTKDSDARVAAHQGNFPDSSHRNNTKKPAWDSRVPPRRGLKPAKQMDTKFLQAKSIDQSKKVKMSRNPKRNESQPSQVTNKDESQPPTALAQKGRDKTNNGKDLAGLLSGGLKIDLTKALQGTIKKSLNKKIGQLMGKERPPPQLCYAPPKSPPKQRALSLQEKLSAKMMSAIQIRVKEVQERNQQYIIEKEVLKVTEKRAVSPQPKAPRSPAPRQQPNEQPPPALESPRRFPAQNKPSPSPAREKAIFKSEEQQMSPIVMPVLEDTDSEELEPSAPLITQAPIETAVIATMTDFPEAPGPEPVVEYRERRLQALSITTNQATVEVEPIEAVQPERFAQEPDSVSEKVPSLQPSEDIVKEVLEEPIVEDPIVKDQIVEEPIDELVLEPELLEVEEAVPLPEKKQMVDVALSVHQFSTSNIEPQQELPKMPEQLLRLSPKRTKLLR